MNAEMIRLMLDIVTINLLFHAVLFGGAGLIVGYQIRRYVAALPLPRGAEE